MLLALSSVLACHAVVDNFRISGIRFHNCLCCLVCALDNIINLYHGTHGDHVGPFIDVDLLSHRFRPREHCGNLFVCISLTNHGEKEKEKEGRSLKSKVK